MIKEFSLGTISVEEEVVSCLDSLTYPCKPKVEDSKQSITPFKAHVVSNFKKFHSSYLYYLQMTRNNEIFMSGTSSGLRIIKNLTNVGQFTEINQGNQNVFDHFGAK